MNGIESVKKNAPIAAVEDQTIEGFEVCKNPKFEVYVDKAGEFRFRLKAKNGEIIATGEGYKAKASCLNGIESVRKNSDSEIKYIEVLSPESLDNVSGGEDNLRSIWWNCPFCYNYKISYPPNRMDWAKRTMEDHVKREHGWELDMTPKR